MEQENIQNNKLINISFGDDCFIVDDTPSFNNLNRLSIDLTCDSEGEREQKNDKAVVKSPLKTLELNLNCTISPVKNIKRPNTDQNNNQLGCSKYIVNEEKRSNLIENHEEFVCSLCYNLVAPKIGVLLRGCLHNFCRPCLMKVIYTKHDKMTGIVKCPLEVENCDKNMDEKEIKELLGDFNFITLKEQIKCNIEDSLEKERRRKIEEQELLLPMLLNMTDLPTIPNLESFYCVICMTQIDVGAGIVLQNCLHKFCRDCLAGCIDSAEEFEVKCPFIEGEKCCEAVLKEVEVRELVTAEKFEKHLEKSLKIAESANELTFHCRTPDCPSFIELGDELLVNFKCLSCEKVNCIPCKAIHEGISCNDYKEIQNPQLKDERLASENQKSEKAILDMIRNNQAMYCPRCNIPVQKIVGCDFITCTGCKLGICWATKKPRNDLMKPNGTVVEGCRCNQAPLYKKCHPNCQNCH